MRDVASEAAVSTYRPSFHEVLDFVRQCGNTNNSQKELIESALCLHYGIKEAKCLGHGTIGSLLAAAKKNRKRSQNNNILYESALCAKSKNLLGRGATRQVGLLGSQSQDKVLACLQSCPLLEDLAEWSHWDLVFKPEFGELKTFLQEYGGIQTMNVDTGAGNRATMTTNILALETKPGVLLKITGNTSPDHFINAALAGDVNATCGHLVSLVVAKKGLENTPLVLLGEHVKTSLLKMQAADLIQIGQGAPSSKVQSRKMVQFALDCLTRVPLVICQAVASQVFLEPLIQVLGDNTSQELLVQCSTHHHFNRLQCLGFLCGIDDWTQSFQDRLAPPEHCKVEQKTMTRTELKEEPKKSRRRTKHQRNQLMAGNEAVLNPLHTDSSGCEILTHKQDEIEAAVAGILDDLETLHERDNWNQNSTQKHWEELQNQNLSEPFQEYQTLSDCLAQNQMSLGKQANVEVVSEQLQGGQDTQTYVDTAEYDAMSLMDQMSNSDSESLHEENIPNQDSSQKRGQEFQNQNSSEPSQDHESFSERHGQKQRLSDIQEDTKVRPEEFDFDTHMRSHTGDKSYTCSVCGESFIRQVTLKFHMSTHTGEKPYKCSVCSKSYMNKATLQSHMKTHTHRKAHECPKKKKVPTATLR